MATIGIGNDGNLCDWRLEISNETCQKVINSTYGVHHDWKIKPGHTLGGHDYLQILRGLVMTVLACIGKVHS
jgi:hypothetical protein